jgi:primosomal protein N' (replication factor Y) (superfamily II helicase)
MKFKYADIAFPTAVRRVFTYRIPAELNLKPGMRVWVPLKSETSIGMVVRVHGNKPDFKTKVVFKVLDREPVLDDSLLKLTDWIHRFYYCSWGEVIQAALPVGLNFISEKKLRVNFSKKNTTDLKDLEILNDIDSEDLTLQEARKRWRGNQYSKRLKKMIKQGIVEVWEEPQQKVGYKTAKHWDWHPEADIDSVLKAHKQDNTTKWIRALKVLREIKLPAAHRQLLKIEPLNYYTLRRIEKEGLLVSREMKVSTGPVSSELYNPGLINELSVEQEEVFKEVRNKLKERKYHSFLLYGVTGSGKTEVYIHALKHALSQNRGGMVLVPEIALTPQTVRRFYQIFGDKISVIHSRLNDRERYEAWQGLQSGDKQIVIGPRSAVFAPVKNLGFIVVDEEHDGSYKQFDPSPRYHARDVAIMRAYLENAVVLMGSATPSMTSLQGVINNKHTMLQLPTRPGGKMPEVRILDMKQYSSAMQGPLTVSLFEAISEALQKEEQVILLYNRRGYASYLQCDDCGHIPQSPDCSVSLTYHKNKNMLLCHYSGYSRRADTHCEVCGSNKMNTRGSGTQQLEDDIRDLFPNARLLRMDKDSTSGKYAHQEIYEAFLSGGADILIGTQLVSKGLDFPNVTVVGVLNAETELAFPSFRSGERMFQLLSQVAGRAGRAEKTGNVYIQTWKPDHRSIRYAKTHDFRSFAKEELAERRSLNYPPFSRMIVFQFKGKSSDKTESVAVAFTESMRQVFLKIQFSDRRLES